MSEKILKKENARVIIEDNIIQFDKNVAQLSNVSCLKIAPMPKKNYPTWAYIMVIIGLIILFENFLLGALIGVIGILVIANVYLQNKELGDYLVISMNSGDSFYFSCNDRRFLEKALEEFKQCFNNHANTVISFQNCQIDSSQIGANNSTYRRG